MLGLAIFGQPHFCPSMLPCPTYSRASHTSALSGPDGSRHSSDQNRKDVNSENSNYCPNFFWEFLSSRRQTPEVWSCCVFTVFEFLSHLPKTSRASRGRKFRFLGIFVFCGHKLLRASLKAPALTGYVGDAQQVPDLIGLILPVFLGGKWHIFQTSAQVRVQENLGGNFGPEKNIYPPPQTPRKTPSRPLAPRPPPARETPPSWDFQ